MDKARKRAIMRPMREIMLATNNPGKLREFNHAFEGTNIRFISLNEAPGAPEVEETGETYEDNAFLKARAIAEYTGKPTVADDSGIEIEALPGEFAVKSARHAGDRPYSEVNDDILARLEGKENRGCRYMVAVVYIDPASGLEEVVHGTCEGIIHDRQTGEGGFGFDPIFYLPEFGKTMAQLHLDVKNRISHRAKAIKKLKKLLV